MDHPPTREAVLERLETVVDPCSVGAGTEHNVREMGMVDQIEIRNGDVTVHLHLTTPHCMMVPYFVDEVDRAVGSLPGVTEVNLETDNGLRWRPSMMDDGIREDRLDRIEAGLEE